MIGWYDLHKACSLDFYKAWPCLLKILGRHNVILKSLKSRMQTFSVLKPHYLCLKFERGQNWDNKAINGSGRTESSLEESSEPKSEWCHSKNYCHNSFVLIFKTSPFGSWIEKFPLPQINFNQWSDSFQTVIVRLRAQIWEETAQRKGIVAFNFLNYYV